MFYSFKYRINNDSYSTLYSTFYIIFGLKTRDESKDQMTYLNQFSQRFLNVSKGLITLKLFRQTAHTKKQVYEDSTQFRDLTMRILKSAFLSSLMLEFISMLGIGLVALEAALSLVVFHNIDFKTAAIAIILAPEFYNAIKDLGQAFHTGKQSEGASDVVFEFLDSENTPLTNQEIVKSNKNLLLRCATSIISIRIVLLMPFVIYRSR